MIKNKDWKTLYAARNKSSEYNKEKFNKEKLESILQKVYKAVTS